MRIKLLITYKSTIIDVYERFSRGLMNQKPSTITPYLALSEKDMLNHRHPEHLPNPAAAYLATLSSGSRRTMHHALNTHAKLLSAGQCDARSFYWASIRHEHVVALRAYLRERYAASTTNKMLSALRRTLREAFLMGQMSEATYRRAVIVERVPHQSLAPSTGRMLQASDVRALLTVCLEDEKPSGVRDAAIISLMCQTGMRRSEIVSLNVADYDPDKHRFLVLASKGNSDRTVFISGGAQQIAADWLSIRGIEAGAFFLPINKGGRIIYQRPSKHGIRKPGRLTAHAIYKMLNKRARQAGLKSMSPHDLRRTFISHFIEATGDIALAAQIVGHQSVETTRGYDRRGEQAKADAPNQIHIPYHTPKLLR